jgi:membrane fusion protein, multidrug efflux system
LITSNRTRAILIAAVLAVFAATGCGTKVAQTAPILAVPVSVAKASQKTIPIDLTSIGSASAYSTVSVESQVDAVLENVYIKEGQFVNKGDLLFTLDSRPFAATLAQAQANLARDKAQAELDNVQANRYQQLYQAGVAAKEQYDQMKANADAEAAAVRADEAAVESAQVQLGYCKIYSPVSGRTGELQVYPGNIVKANSTPALIVINQLTPIYVTFSIPEQYLGNVQKFMSKGRLRVEVTPYGDTQPEVGYLTFVNNAIDTTTGTVTLKGTFANSDHRLWPGQFSTVSLRLAEEENAIVVPSQAVQNGQSGDFIFVVDSNMDAEQRPVKVGRTVGPDTVILSGVKPGETVVTDGQLRLIPGIKVEIKSSVAPSPSVVP